MSEHLFKDAYFRLFGATEDALDLMDGWKISEARERLIQAQREMEEMYMEEAPDEPVLELVVPQPRRNGTARS